LRQPLTEGFCGKKYNRQALVMPVGASLGHAALGVLIVVVCGGKVGIRIIELAVESDKHGGHKHEV